MGEIMEKEKRIDLQIYVYSDNLFLGLFDGKILSDQTKEAIKKDIEKHFEQSNGC
jgi:hypothetical protein